tara:strand:- start:1057 stop:1329 length:273 start_codon:yes stop_codon:yes gene_type:complete
MNAGKTGQDQNIGLGASPIGKTSGGAPAAKSTSPVPNGSSTTGVMTDAVSNNATVTSSSTIGEQEALKSHQETVAEQSGEASSGSNPTSH